MKTNSKISLPNFQECHKNKAPISFIFFYEIENNLKKINHLSVNNNIERANYRHLFDLS